MNQDNELDQRIEEAVRCVRAELPQHVRLLAAAKTRTLDEVKAVIRAGVEDIGYNYVQEALPIIQAIGDQATWHMIGHLQSNKAKAAVGHFDMIETVDSWKLAQALERESARSGREMPVLIEVNSGREENKNGALPDEVEALAEQINSLSYLRLEGLMTMGPIFGDPEDSRPFFRTTRALYEKLAASNLPNVHMRWLSMGMSSSYRVAVEEGANIVRIGTKLFGECG